MDADFERLVVGVDAAALHKECRPGILATTCGTYLNAGAIAFVIADAADGRRVRMVLLRGIPNYAVADQQANVQHMNRLPAYARAHPGSGWSYCGPPMIRVRTRARGQPIRAVSPYEVPHDHMHAMPQRQVRSPYVIAERGRSRPRTPPVLSQHDTQTADFSVSASRIPSMSDPGALGIQMFPSVCHVKPNGTTRADRGPVDREPPA